MRKLIIFLAAALVLSTILSGSCGASKTTTTKPPEATTFVFTTQPAGAVPGKPFTTQPVVTATDDYGNVINSWSTPVTLAITHGAGTSGAKLSGTVTVTPASGVATFIDLSIDLAGATYSLTATSDNLRPGKSIVFVVAAPTSSVPSSTAPATVTVTVTVTKTTT